MRENLNSIFGTDSLILMVLPSVREIPMDLSHGKIRENALNKENAKYSYESINQTS